MKSLWGMLKWHSQTIDKSYGKGDVFNLSVCFVWTPLDGAAAAESDESVVDRSYVKKKLEHGLTRIWQVGKNSLLSLSLSMQGCSSSLPPAAHIYCFSQSQVSLISLLRTSNWKWRPTSWGQTCLTSNTTISSWCWMSSAGTQQGQTFSCIH